MANLPESSASIPEITEDADCHSEILEEARHILESLKLMCSELDSEQDERKGSIPCPNVLANDRSLYEPRMVSIGPHFRGLTKTLRMEDKKLSFISGIFDNYQEAVLECIKCIKIHEKEARECYERIVSISSEDFIKILLLDSIFLMKLILEGYFKAGLLDGLLGPFPDFFLDLILMENQVPFFIIREVWRVLVSTGVINSECSLESELPTSAFWKDGLYENKWELKRIASFTHLYYNWNMPIPVRASKSKRWNPPWLQSWIDRSPQALKSWIGLFMKTRDKRITSTMPSATELYEVGIEFEAKTTFKNMFDISFENGMIKIPTMLIDSKNMSLIVNMLSFEKTLVQPNPYVGNYVFFMDSLINTKNDIALLQKFGVVNNKLASDDAAAAFINSLGDSCEFHMFNSPDFYGPVIEDIMEYTTSSWRRNWTSLKHTYFSNPWTAISVFAASYILIISSLQTYYTIFPRGH